MDARQSFVESYLGKADTMSGLCRTYEISRKTGYKWVARYRARGAGGLANASRRPTRIRHAVDDTAVAQLLALRETHPTWGPKKLIAYVAREQPDMRLPSHATVSRILAKRGLAMPQKGRARPASYKTPYADYIGPNVCWSVDFKGHFALSGRTVRVYPLTVMDVPSRYILRIKALKQERYQPVKQVFDRLFRQYGLPDAIRSDNGSPFASLAPGGLSQLSIWWIKLGITPIRIQPGRPTQNSRHERMHRTLKAECPIRHTWAKQQEALDQFTHVFNTKRPHQALANKRPADIYCPSIKHFPRRIKPPTYPSADFVERIGSNGVLSFNGVSAKITPLLTGELIGLTKTNHRTFSVYFGPVKLGVLNHKGFQMDIFKRKPKTK